MRHRRYAPRVHAMRRWGHIQQEVWLNFVRLHSHDHELMMIMLGIQKVTHVSLCVTIVRTICFISMLQKRNKPALSTCSNYSLGRQDKRHGRHMANSLCLPCYKINKGKTSDSKFEVIVQGFLARATNIPDATFKAKAATNTHGWAEAVSRKVCDLSWRIAILQ